MKGASQVDEELSLRMLNKQGAFYRLMPFNGLKAEQIRNETLLRIQSKGLLHVGHELSTATHHL
jgi:hypothetical protein